MMPFDIFILISFVKAYVSAFLICVCLSLCNIDHNFGAYLLIMIICMIWNCIA